MTLVKICGITRVEDARAVAAAGADAIGFVFWPGSPRHVTPRAAGALSAAVPPLVRKVGVFVDQASAEIEEAVGLAGLDIVQLHGAEPADLARRLSRPVWRAVHDAMPPEALDGYPAAAFLVDGAPVGTYGGAGVAPDETRISMAGRLGPLVLAGGLTTETVGPAVARYRPHAVDVSSGVETAPGIKDHARVRAFVAQVRQAAAQRNRNATDPSNMARSEPLIDHLTA